MVIPEDIEKLHQVAIELGKRPNYEGRLFLEFKLGGLRQYVALTIAHSLFGDFSAAESIDFIQEQWQVNVLGQDEIDQWVVAANGNGTALRVWHKRLREDKGAVVREELIRTDQQGTKAIVKNIVARLLTSQQRI